MMHKPIQLKNISLSFSHKTCFEDFSTQIYYGSRIAIIGRNGSGKSFLLKIVQKHVEPTSGVVTIPEDVVLGTVPQVISEFEALSGGERFNEALTQALANNPNVLLLDEPTNHLDRRNRASLMRMLRSFTGTLIVASHDVELLRTCVDTLWHIDDGKIHLFSGKYDDYMGQIRIKRESAFSKLSRLSREKKELHGALMKEQERSAKSRAQGKKNIDRCKWPTIVSKAKASRANETAGSKRSAIDQKKEDLEEELLRLHVPEVIVPHFSLSIDDVRECTLVSISDGSIGHKKETPLLHNIRFSVGSKDRIALCGANGCGKSTFIQAILGNKEIRLSGNWYVPKAIDIGYLDQHYGTLNLEKTVFEAVSEADSSLSSDGIRRHLSTFLFRKNEEVFARVSTLSGGERARLSLALLAIKSPKLLILDEITNNLDLETVAHIIQVLREYPGAMIVVSHDENFLKEIGIRDVYTIEDGTMKYQV